MLVQHLARFEEQFHAEASSMDLWWFFFFYLRANKDKKNDTHGKNVGHTSEFLFGITDELEKQIIIKKTVEVGQWKINLNIYNVAFLKRK